MPTPSHAYLHEGPAYRRDGTEQPDVVTPWLAVECKQRARLPAWLTTALGTIRQQAGGNRLGIVVLHQAGAHDSVVLLSLRDFRDWFGELPEGAGE